MAYFDNTDNAGFYSTSSAPEEFDAYPFLSRMSAAEGADNQTFNTFVHGWGMVEQPGPIVGEPTSHWAAVTHEPVAPTMSWTTQLNAYGQPSYSTRDWPAVSQQVRPYHSGLSSQDGYFDSTIASGASTGIPTPSSSTLDYWGGNQSGPSTNTFYTENVHTYHQPSTGPTRTGLMQTERFQPYGMSRTRPNEYRNAEAGPSTLVPPTIPYAGSLTPQPSGGISETTADAETHQTISEEDKTPAAKQTRRPRGQAPLRRHRMLMQQYGSKLCEWVEKQTGLREAPTLNRALAVAVDTIQTIRELVYPEPRLLIGQSKRTVVGSKTADEECARRGTERTLFQELSRYYPLEEGQPAWTRSDLLSQVVKDLENLSAPPGPSGEVASRPSTPTVEI